MSSITTLVLIVLELLRGIEGRLEDMAGELQALTTQVKANTDAEQSAIQLLSKLSDLIKAAGTDPAKLQQLTSDLDSSRAALAAAVVANTPQSPAPAPTPTPAPPPAPAPGPAPAPPAPGPTPAA